MLHGNKNPQTASELLTATSEIVPRAVDRLGAK